MTDTKVIADGLYFGESPRWHAGQLWFSDIHGQTVYRMSIGGQPQEVLRLEDDLPSGLGWLPDGRLLVVEMNSQRVRRLEPDGTLSVHADLAGVATGTLNDMVVDHRGVAFVGDTGFSMWDEHLVFKPGRLFAVSPNGDVLDILEGLRAPNGVAASGSDLVVAQSGGPCLTLISVTARGTFDADRRDISLADVSPVAPDGICLDHGGGVWLADPVGRRVMRVNASGAVTETMDFEDQPVACVLGGEDRQTLLVCVAPDWRREAVLRAPLGRIIALPAHLPGVGTP
jgi:sugar lactone lactonase YvrE